MEINSFRIRDPFILLHENKYYLYGTTRLEKDSTRGEGGGFDVFVSDDLCSFEGPYSVFEPDSDFWGKTDFWAPEVHEYNGAFYMLATFKNTGILHGVGILKADTPMGPFRPHSEMPITPRDWSSLDGTLFIEDGKPYMVFCHEWIQIIDGTMCYAELSEDLTHFVTEPKTMFAASENPHATYSRFRDGTLGYVTDGPCMHRTPDGSLLMLWASGGKGGYTEYVSRSDNGRLDGHFGNTQIFYGDNGGHGMLFRDRSGSLKFTLHAPNIPSNERAAIFSVEETEDSISLETI